MIKQNHTTSFGVFRVGERLFGVPIESLAEVCSVPSVSKLMTGRGPVLGAFDLRGHLVPLLDGEVLSGAGRHARSVEKAAIIQEGDQIVAIVLDDVVDLVEASPVQTLRARDKNAEQPPSEPTFGAADVFPSGFVMKGEVVSCLEASSLFARDDILCATRPKNGENDIKSGPKDKYLIFSAGGATFAIETEHIWATVPRKQLDTRGIRAEGGIILGFIQHIGWKIPVVDTNMILGVGQVAEPVETEVVVLRFPGDKLLGLHVDATERLTALSDDVKKPTSALMQSCGLLRQVASFEGENQAFLLEFDALETQPELRSIADFAARSPERETPVVAPSRGENTSVREEAKYLVFEAGCRWAVPAEQITRILNAPEAVVPARNMPLNVRGFFSVGSHSIPLVALSDTSDDRAPPYVLLVSHDAAQVGFLADRICGIQTSQLRIPNCNPRSGETDLIQMRDYGGQDLIPAADLRRIAQGLNEAGPKIAGSGGLRS